MKIIHRRHLATPIVCLSACFISTAHAQTTTTQTAPAQAAIETPAREVIPVVPLPNPNGYDFFVRAGAALKTENAGPPSVAPSKEAATNLALQRAFVAKNAETLRLLREGLRYPARRPVSRTNADITKSFATETQFREMARLLVQESRVRVADGDLNGAADSLLDGIQFGTDIVRGGPFMTMMVGGAVEAISRTDLWQLTARLDAANARRLTKRLEEIEAARVSLTAVLEEEKWFGFSLLLENFRSPEWAALRAAKTDEATAKKQSAEEAKAEAEFKNTSDAQIKKNYLDYMDAAVANTRKPYNIALIAPPAPADALSRAFTGDVVAGLNARVIYERTVAANRLLIVAFALRAYRLEHDAFPATLNELAPAYLAKIPIDPFSSSGALPGYRREKDAYVLYSVGPDGVDNNATAIPTRRVINAESEGDIVVGANT